MKPPQIVATGPDDIGDFAAALVSLRAHSISPRIPNASCSGATVTAASLTLEAVAQIIQELRLELRLVPRRRDELPHDDKDCGEKLVSRSPADALASLDEVGRSDRSVDFKAGDLWLRPLTRQLRRGLIVAELSPTEFNIIEFLVRRRGQVVMIDKLTAAAWPKGQPRGETVRAAISRLRAKIKPLGLEQAIITAHGKGFLFQASAQ